MSLEISCPLRFLAGGSGAFTEEDEDEELSSDELSLSDDELS